MRMHILLLRHYPLGEGPSMRAFADQIANGLRARGHTVLELTAPVLMARLVRRTSALAKLLGYLDQFVLFPPLLWWSARSLPTESLCVFADQALGPWIPTLKRRPHLVHVHDLLALEAALGCQPFHRLSWSGKFYQRWIRSGFRQARCFLPDSKATCSALEKQLQHRPLLNEVLYIPLQTRFRLLPVASAAAAVAQTLPGLGSERFLFHIGRNWYKNRLGLLAIWKHLQLISNPIHLVLVGAVDTHMESWIRQHPMLDPFLHVLDRASDELVVALYNRAAALVFPSHAEGFGWPILEALACGCPVLTTDRAPMTEVGGDAITTIPPAPPPPASLEDWAASAAWILHNLLERTLEEQARVRMLGFKQAQKFSLTNWVEQLEMHYKDALTLQYRN